MLDKYIRTKTFTYAYSAALFVYAVFVILCGWEEYSFFWIRVNVNDYMYIGLQGLILIASVMMVVSSRLSDAMLPAMMLAVLSTACYDSSSKFLSLKFLWVVPFALFAVVFHFIKYRKPFKIGKSFWGLCAVSVAVTLGGLGTISASEYFGGAALFYVFGLGIGMILFYLLIKSQMGEDEKQSVARVIYLTGLLAALSVYMVYALTFKASIAVGRLLNMQFCNNLSTFIMISLPFALFYPSRKKRALDIVAFFLMYAAIALSGSRGGFLFGTIEVLCLLAVYCFVYRRGHAALLPRTVFIGILAVGGFLFWYFLPDLLYILRLGSGAHLSRIESIKDMFASFFNGKEPRFKMFGRMIRDFSSNPLFGAGLGSTGNADIYNPVKGAMHWYHMWLPQIVGSLGLVGIAAYGYQFFARVKIYLGNPGFVNRTFFLSYIGLLLMSQVNPGEFCPVPYAMLAVTCFVLIERPEDDIPLSGLFAKRRSVQKESV